MDFVIAISQSISRSDAALLERAFATLRGPIIGGRRLAGIHNCQFAFLACELLFCSALTPIAMPADSRSNHYLVVTHGRNARSMESVESVLVNGTEHVRISSVSASRPAVWSPRVVGQLPHASLSSMSAIRRAPDGVFWGRSAASTEWVLLLPDGVKTKTAATAADLWKGSTIGLKRGRSDKDTTPVLSDDVYAIVPGSDIAGSAVRISTELSFHKVSGVEHPEAFRHMVELVPAAVKICAGTPAAVKIRDFVLTSMTERQQKWIDGDAEITVLEQALLLADTSEQAFPQDGTLTKQRDEIRDGKRRLDRRVAVLRSLDAGGLSDAFLVAYWDFEPFDRSFRDLAQFRRKHLEASALAHMDQARRLRTSGDYVGAIRHLRAAQLRNPNLGNATKLLEEVRLEVARLSSRQFAEAHRDLDPRSPTRVQIQRRLRLAEQYMSDNKYNEAFKALEEAESIDQDEPRIRLLQAKLAVQRGDLALALAVLDLYAGMATSPQDFAEGEQLRSSVQYKLENQRRETDSQLKMLFSRQSFGAALQSSSEALKLDNEEPEFLYQAGVNACLLRHCSEVAPLLQRFLDISDSTTASREQRLSAMRLLKRAELAKLQPTEKTNPKNRPRSWFSGMPLEAGVFYDPVSLAFQPKVTRISASDHLNIEYEWAGDQLRSVHTKYEEKKTGGNIARLALGVGMASMAGSGAVMWKTPDRETNDFYFNYYDDVPQVLNINRDNRVVKSQTKAIMIPGFGGLGAFAGMGGLGMLSAAGSLGGFGRLGQFGNAGSMASLAQFKELASLARSAQFTGIGSMDGLLATASSVSRRTTLDGFRDMAGMGFAAAGVARGFTSNRSYTIHNDPEGGSSSGFVTLWNNPRIDTSLAYLATGKRVAVGFSGNHFFHPFAWDGIHVFELDYDSQGRVQHAWELDQPNPPRLDFTWEGKRLISIVARETSASANMIYTRTLTYSGDKLTGETITANGKTSHIRYKYDKQANLIEAECEADASLDGRSRKMEFLNQTSEKLRN